MNFAWEMLNIIEKTFPLSSGRRNFKTGLLIGTATVGPQIARELWNIYSSGVVG